jgi:hypothetical protein
VAVVVSHSKHARRLNDTSKLHKATQRLLCVDSQVMIVYSSSGAQQSTVEQVSDRLQATRRVYTRHFVVSVNRDVAA